MVVVNPPHLSLQKRLATGFYTTEDAVISDIRLTFDNAMRFNPPDNLVHVAAKRLLQRLDLLLQQPRPAAVQPSPRASALEAGANAMPRQRKRLKQNLGDDQLAGSAGASNGGSVAEADTSFKRARREDTNSTSGNGRADAGSATSTTAAVMDITEHKSSEPPPSGTPFDVAACSRLLEALINHDCSGPFLKPVDPVALEIPDYLTRIKTPMDLGTVKVLPLKIAVNLVLSLLVNMLRNLLPLFCVLGVVSSHGQSCTTLLNCFVCFSSCFLVGVWCWD